MLTIADMGNMAGGIVHFVVLVCWVVVIAFTLIGVCRGLVLLKGGKQSSRRWAMILLVVSGLLPSVCCGLPTFINCYQYGNFPIGQSGVAKVAQGMRKEEVLTTLGTPHQRIENDVEERWYYWVDLYGETTFCVRFGPDGRVKDTYNPD
jgi:hypothetical protein